MDTKVKDTALFIFILLTILSFIFAFNSSIKAGKNKRSFEKEMAFRLDLEESLNNLRREKIQLTNALKDKELEIQKNKELIENLNQVISKQDKEISALNDEYKKETLLKEKLEDNLKEELSKKAGSSGK